MSGEYKLTYRLPMSLQFGDRDTETVYARAHSEDEAREILLSTTPASLIKLPITVELHDPDVPVPASPVPGRGLHAAWYTYQKPLGNRE